MDLFDDIPEPVNKELMSENVLRNTGVVLEEGEVQQNGKGAKRRKSSDDDCDAKTDVVKRPCGQPEVLSTLRGHVAERRGERDDMQDAHAILDRFQPEGDRLSFYAVFDGHGGARASAFAAKTLGANLAARLPKGDVAQIEKDIRRSFISAFKKTDEDFLKEATKQKPSWKDGTTALTILAIRNTLYIANLGDSKAILYRRSKENERGSIVSLSRDHNPTSYDERMRIQKMGGFVRDGRVMGILEVSRSIGDGQYKTLGVTCLPDIKRCQLTENDRFIIMACDGLWKVFSCEEAVDFVARILKDKSGVVNQPDPSAYDTACVRLAHEALLRGSGDNVTVLIVEIDWDSAG